MYCLTLLGRRNLTNKILTPTVELCILGAFLLLNLLFVCNRSGWLPILRCLTIIGCTTFYLEVVFSRALLALFVPLLNNVVMYLSNVTRKPHKSMDSFLFPRVHSCTCLLLVTWGWLSDFKWAFWGNLDLTCSAGGGGLS